MVKGINMYAETVGIPERLVTLKVVLIDWALNTNPLEFFLIWLFSNTPGCVVQKYSMGM